jgi:hypothetical protein
MSNRKTADVTLAQPAARSHEPIRGMRATSVLRSRYRVAIGAILALPIVGVAALLILWLAAFIDPAPQQDDCAFRSVGPDEYRELRRQADARGVSLWPGLSRGVIWPSNRPFAQPTWDFEPALGQELLRAIELVAGTAASSDRQLAAAHAVMRSMRAEYIGAWNIPDPRENGRLASTRVHFNYFMPQRRLAPLCLHCLAWPYTTIGVVFRHEIGPNTYGLDHVVVLNGGLKYDPAKERNISDACPSFPKT